MTIDTPYGQFTVKKGSWVNVFSGADGTTIGKTIHLRNKPRYGLHFLCHEVGHAVRWLGGFWPFQILHYLVSPSFRKQEERAAEDFADQHWTELWVAEALRKIQA